MKKYLLLSLLICLFFLSHKPCAQAQFSLQFGYNAGVPTSLGNLNYVLDRYNETRTYLDKQMGHIGFLDGTTLSLGGVFQRMLIGCGYTAGGQKRFAEMTDSNGDVQRRELWVKERLFDMDFGVLLGNPAKTSVCVGALMQLGNFTVNTRVAPEADIKDEDWTKINTWGDLKFTGGFFLRLQLSNPGIYIQPYYAFTPGAVFYSDVTEINEKLNPNTYESDPSPINVKYNTVGVKIGLSILMGGD